MSYVVILLLSFITVNEMEQLTTSLFGKKVANRKTHYMYQSDSAYGEETIIAHINEVNKVENGIFVKFSSEREMSGKFSGNYKAILKRNTKSPVGYILVPIVKLNNAAPTVKNATASLVLSFYGQIQYIPINLMDGKISTLWCKGVNGVGTGQWAKLNWTKKEIISAVVIYAGYQKSNALLQKNGIPVKMKMEFSDGSFFIINTDDYRNYMANQKTKYFYLGEGRTLILFPKRIKTSNVKIAILKANSGTKYTDTCISELKFY